jgi:DNA-binding LacI/PurR family transcriptional regulator
MSSAINLPRSSARPGRPRQSDIARQAGVSQTTVSLVLRGHTRAAGIATETEDRVRAVARSLGYIADPVATRMAGQRNSLLGVYTFSATFPLDGQDTYYPFLAGVEERAAECGYDLLLFTGSSPGGGRSHGADALDRLRLADGSVLMGRHAPIRRIVGLASAGYPVVFLGRRSAAGTTIPYVGADYVTASHAVAQRLAAAGHRRITYLREPDVAPPSEDRELGLRQGAHDAAVDLDVRVCSPGQVDPTLLQHLRRRDRVTAVVLEGTDTSAVAHDTLRSLPAAGLSVPDDLSVAALGDLTAPPSPQLLELSGFALPRTQMGRHAVDLLIDLLNGPVSPDGRQRLLDCPTVDGATIGPAPAQR